MKIYFAPLEGITGYIYRRNFEEFYGKGRIDKYFIPFISPGQKGRYTTKELKDVAPEHNRGMYAVPQIMANKADFFIEAVRMLEQLGYKEVNLNLGCPSGTVVSKNKGAGFLAMPDSLDEFFEQVFQSGMFGPQGSGRIKLSVKTRIGMEDEAEFERILGIYNSYEFEEIIVHPRVRSDYYKKAVHKEMFSYALKNSRNKVSYNGDIFTRNDFAQLNREFPQLDSVMIGRGFIADPSFINVVTAKNSGSQRKCQSESENGLQSEYQRNLSAEQQVLKQFHDRLLKEYCVAMSGDQNALHKMKELWFYMGRTFDDSDKLLKKIKKSQKMQDYQDSVSMLFAQSRLMECEHMLF